MRLKHRIPGAVLYGRVSTPGQAKLEVSLSNQMEVMRSHAAQLDKEVLAEYEDAGVSGARYDTRPGIQASLADLERGAGDTLIVYESKRKGRGVELALDILKRIKKAGARLYYCDRGYVDLENKLSYMMDAYIDEKDRDDIRVRLKNGKNLLAKRGLQPTRSQSPYGYHVVTKKDMMDEIRSYSPDKIGQYVIVEEEAVVIRRIFAEYATGQESLHSLCRKINAEGLLPSRSAITGNSIWHPSTIRNILRNTVYKGEPIALRFRSEFDEDKLNEIDPATGRNFKTPYRSWQAPEEEWVRLSAPAIIEAELWDRAQSMLPANRTSHKSGNPRRSRMLTGRVHCPHCGSKTEMRSSGNAGKYKYYHCSRHLQTRSTTGQKVCSGESYSVYLIEEAVVTTIKSACATPELITAAIAAFAMMSQASSHQDDNSKHLRDIDNELVGLDKDEENLVDAQLAGMRVGASASAYSAKFAKIASRRAELEERRKQLMSSTRHTVRPRARRQDYRDILSDLLLVLASEDVTGAEKRDLLGRIIDRVVCMKDGAEIHFVPGLFDQLGSDTVQMTLTTSSNTVGPTKSLPCFKGGMCASFLC